jgi:hypothetical protein
LKAVFPGAGGYSFVRHFRCGIDGVYGCAWHHSARSIGYSAVDASAKRLAFAIHGRQEQHSKHPRGYGEYTSSKSIKHFVCLRKLLKVVVSRCAKKL